MECITIYASSKYQYETHNVLVENNTTQDGYCDEIEMWGVKDCIIRNNDISAPNILNHCAYGAVNIVCSKNIKVYENSIENVPTSGISSFGSKAAGYNNSECENIEVLDNNITTWNRVNWNAFTTSNWDYVAAINMHESLNSKVMYNSINDNEKTKRNSSIRSILSLAPATTIVTQNENHAGYIIDYRGSTNFSQDEEFE